MFIELILVVVSLSFLLINWKFYANKKLIVGFRGPKGIPIIGSAYEFGRGNIAERIVPYLEKVVDDYGPRSKLFFGWKPNAIITTVEDVEKILGSVDCIEKPGQYLLIRQWLGDGLATSSGKRWQRQRKLLAPAFHYKVIDDSIPIVDEKAKIFISILKTKMETNQTQIKYEIGLLLLDIVCETTMGHRINAQIKDTPFISAVNNTAIRMMARMFKPWLRFDILWNLSSAGKETAKELETLRQVTRTVIAEKKKQLTANRRVNSNREASNNDEIGIKNKRGFLDLLLEVQDENPETLSDLDIIHQVSTFLFAGQDTVATAIGWALLILGNHPECQKKVHEELDIIFGNDRNRSITSEDLRRMEYLEMAIKESMRMFGVAPCLQREITTPLHLGDGAILKAGVTAWIFLKHVHYNPKYWKSPEEFIPERFTAENSKGRHPYAYLAFSAGPRNCIGQKSGMMEMKIVLANIFRNFSVRSVKSLKEIKPLWEIVCVPQGGVEVELTLR